MNDPMQIALHRRQELMEEIVHPGALECRARIAEEIGEMREQLRKQLIRVRELRVRKVEEPGARLLSYSFFMPERLMCYAGL